MKTVLPASFAPTGTIRRLPTFPKCTGSRLWQTGQILMLVSPAQSGHVACAPAASAAKAGGNAPLNPVRSRSTGSTSAAQRFPLRLIRPVHRNQPPLREISS